MTDLNTIFNEFARALVGTVKLDGDVASPDRLPVALLDGSLESLHRVDEYLKYLHEHRDGISQLEWDLTLLRAGAYVGEVIRHAAPDGEFNWVDYNEYMPEHPDLKRIIPERTSATCAFLVRRSGTMSMPLNKIARFIDDGPENSVHYFAVCDLKDFRGEGSA